MPFALKLYESLLESVPTHRPCCSPPAAASRSTPTPSSKPTPRHCRGAEAQTIQALRERALKLYLRARGYCLRAVDVRFGEGTSEALLQDPEAVVAKAKREDVPLLYWTAASWGAAISLGPRSARSGGRSSNRARAGRSRAGARPDVEQGRIHELMISLDSLPEALGGNPERAREHFKTAVEMQKGLSPGPYVALATGVAVPTQDRAGVRAAAQGGPGDRSGEGPVEPPGHAGHADGARACCSIGSTRSSRNERKVWPSWHCGGCMFRSTVVLTLAVVSLVASRRRREQTITIKLATQAPVNLLVAQGPARHGRRVGSQDRRPREADVYAGGTQGSEDATIRMMRPGVDQLQANLLTLPGPVGTSTTPSTCSACPFFFQSDAEATVRAREADADAREAARGQGLQAARLGQRRLGAALLEEADRPRLTDVKAAKLFTSQGDDRMVQWYKQPTASVRWR